jgi:mono/diheme cytochrome c family protein
MIHLPQHARGEPLLAVRGQVAGAPFALGRADLAGLPRASFEGVDPATGRSARFEGLALGLLLAERIERLAGADTAVIETGDGLRLALPLTWLRERQALLADRIDGVEAPLQLAWPNRAQPGLDLDPRGPLLWAHGVVAVEVIRWDATWGRALAAPTGAADPARRGAGEAALRCAGCHAVRGAGGRRGPALDGSVERLGVAGFEAAVRAHPAWPSHLGVELRPDAEVLAELEAFLATAQR